MPKKSKPKQRTNWKQRALHCEEVIGVQKTLAEAREERLEQCRKYQKAAADHIIEISIVADCQQGQIVLDSVKALKARAEKAEKHNALLLEEREAKVLYSGTVCAGCYQQKCRGECMSQADLHGQHHPVDDPFCCAMVADCDCRNCLNAEKDKRESEAACQRIADRVQQKCDTKLTHWQRFKSWFTKYYVELLFAVVAYFALARLLTISWKQGG